MLAEHVSGVVNCNWSCVCTNLPLFQRKVRNNFLTFFRAIIKDIALFPCLWQTDECLFIKHWDLNLKCHLPSWAFHGTEEEFGIWTWEPEKAVVSCCSTFSPLWLPTERVASWAFLNYSNQFYGFIYLNDSKIQKLLCCNRFSLNTNVEHQKITLEQ